MLTSFENYDHSLIKYLNNKFKKYHPLAHMIADTEQATRPFVMIICFGFLLRQTVMPFSLNHIRLLRLVGQLSLKQDGAWERKLR